MRYSIWSSMARGWVALLLSLALGACAGPATPPTAVPPTLAPPTSAPTTPATAVPTAAPPAAASSAVGATAAPATPAASFPSLLYIAEGGLFAHSGDGEPRRLVDVPGKAIAAALAGDVLLVLREQGLERVRLAGGQADLVLPVNAIGRFGAMVPVREGAEVYVAAVTDAPSAQSGAATLIGVYRAADDSARPIYATSGAMFPLGLSANGRGLYLLPRGQDPSFTEVYLLDLISGNLDRSFPVAGDGTAALSPHGRTIVTTQRRFGGDPSAPPANLIAVYDMEAEEVVPRDLPLPRAPSAATAIVWDPDSETIYVTLGAGDLYDMRGSYGLWRMDVASGEAALVADVNVETTRLEGISPDGKTLLLRNANEEVVLVDVATGATANFTLPAGAVVAGWRP